MKRSKIIVSLILVISIVASLAMPCFASAELVERGSQYPTIVISGDSAEIVDAEGNTAFQVSKIFSSINIDKDSIVDTIVDIYKPYYLEGRLQGNYENYYQAIYDFLAPMFEAARLDENGDPSNGSHLNDWLLGCNNWSVNNNTRQDDGFTREAYHFWYDWRLDPMEVADQFNEYVQGIKRVTGCDKVVVNSMCLGTDILMAYLAKYGTDDLHGVSFDGSVVAGAELLSDPVSGKFNLDGDAIVRFLTDSVQMDLISVDEVVIDVVDALEQSGVLAFVEGYTKAVVYDQVKEGLTSVLSRSTFYTWPGYWAPICANDYETAKDYIFGKEGSELRQQYAGLIEKLDNYDANVRQRIPELLQEIKDSGINVCVIAKYGVQIGPITQSNDQIADQIATVKNASFGATTSTIYERLSDEYIVNQVSKGLSKYISPDLEIDASTCFFPDNTWFVKGARHSNWTYIEGLISYTVSTADKQYTVDDFDISQFIVYNNETQQASKMTNENCDTYYWEADYGEDKSWNPIKRLKKFFEAWNKLIRRIIEIYKDKKAAEAEQTTTA